MANKDKASQNESLGITQARPLLFHLVTWTEFDILYAQW